MKSKKIILTLVVLAVAGTTLFLGIKSWRNTVVQRQERRAYALTQQLLARSDYDTALVLIRQQAGLATKLNWQPLEVCALAGRRSAPELAAIYQHAPARIAADEEASLVLARAFLASRNAAALAAIRKSWTGRETRPADWLVLDSDVCLMAGKSLAAEKILRSRQFTGPAEASRLERLALLVASRDLPQAWQLLSAATELDARNPELRSFRGQMLESAGKPEAARLEYYAAVLAQTNNPLLTDQLAEFYRRQNNYDAALATWEAALSRPSFDFIALKTAFWQRLIRPGQFAASQVPDGELQPLARWIDSLDATAFYNEASFTLLPASPRLIQQRPELFWLRLAQALQQKHETEAAGLLQFNPFRSRSWQPDLEIGLARILHYRQKHSLNPPDLRTASDTPAAERPELFSQLESLAAQERTTGRAAIPADLDALLRGPDAFVAAFLAAGWREAALRLCAAKNVSPDEPAWFTYGLAQCLRANRRPAVALEFLATRKSDPALKLLAAEIKIETGNAAAGLADLVPLAPQNSAVGFRASYILALANVDAGKFAEARKWALQNPLLAADSSGRELLASIAVRTGRMAEAESIYQSIASNSLPAKAFLAKRAFDRHDWAGARQLTSELVQLVPEELQFRANLRVLDQKIAGK